MNGATVGMRLKIVAIRDSTTAGTPGFLSPLEAPADGEANRESQYTHWMTEAHPEWVVLNRGINGQRSDEILARFKGDVIDENPDLVIILAGVNDIFQGLPLETIKRNLRTIYPTAINSGIRAFAATVLPFNDASESQSKAVEELNNWVKETAALLGIGFCDTHSVVADPTNPNRLRSSPDGNHPDVDGYRRIGQALAEVIRRVVKPPRR